MTVMSKCRLYCAEQGWEGYFGNVIGYRSLVTLFKMLKRDRKSDRRGVL